MEKERIFEVIADVLSIDIERVTPEEDLRRNLGADSIDLVHLIMVFEDTFDIQLSDDEVSHIKTVQDILDYAEKVGL